MNIMPGYHGYYAYKGCILEGGFGILRMGVSICHLGLVYNYGPISHGFGSDKL